jgi:hypothetical protein
VLREEWVEEAVPVPIAGTNRLDFKDLSHPGPAHVQFETVTDLDLRSRLERLIEFASASTDRKRAIRDAGEGAIGTNLALEGGRNVVNACGSRPMCRVKVCGRSSAVCGC